MTRRSLPTRILHWAIAVAVAVQLVGVSFVARPQDGQPGNGFFAVHQWLGLATLALLAAFWTWSLVRTGEHRIGALVPWFSARRRRALRADLRDHAAAMRRWRLPAPAAETPLASAIHGLGLSIATLMAGTGAIVFLGMSADGTLGTAASAALTAHSLASNAMWAYLVGHVSVVVVHEWLGHPVLRRMLGGRA
jgi:cytochrome b561